MPDTPTDTQQTPAAPPAAAATEPAAAAVEQTPATPAAPAAKPATAKPAAPLPKVDPKPADAAPFFDPDAIPGRLWAIGNHDRQVKLAGLLADQPGLRNAKQNAEQWQAAITKYMKSPRPPHKQA